MIFIAEIDVMPHTEILDPQGKAVRLGLHNLGIDHVQDVRVGKHITLRLEAESTEAATTQVERACRELLANAIMERFTYRLAQAEPSIPTR